MCMTILRRLDDNNLTSVPDLTGLKTVELMSLRENQIEQLPAEVFQNVNVLYALDLSFNKKLSSIPDGAFSGLKQLEFDSLFIFICRFLHGNRIKNIDANAFRGLTDLRLVTLFENPALMSLPRNVFNGLTENVTLALSCKTLKELPRGINEARVVCAPTESLFVIVSYRERRYQRDGLLASGFMCPKCRKEVYPRCLNCSLCSTGTYSSRDTTNTHCLRCPAGGFYQDEMGQIDCKTCSIGTYVPEINYPGKSATDCRACPYGTNTNEIAGYRACRCLHKFYRLDRFGPCKSCPYHGMNCENDTAILAPNYFWKWNSSEKMESYRSFVQNIQITTAEYNKTFSTFEGLLPKPLKCPYPDSCKGGINSTCSTGYQGTLCAACSSYHYLRFNRCLKCPKSVVTVISCGLILLFFVLLFVIVFKCDSRRTGDNRFVADVVMSCIKIIIGFYQVLAGIFSALLHVQWPMVILSAAKCLKFVEGNILQFAPLSCIHPVLRLDPFIQFVLAVTINVFAVSLILLYLFFKMLLLNRMENSTEESNSKESTSACSRGEFKREKISNLKKSCYRNIFLFLLLSYPITSKKIINILPLPGACVKVCFLNDDNDCISLLKADYSIPCSTSRHSDFWHIAAGFALYPIAFPILLLALLWKCRKYPQKHKQFNFGLKVFYENYKDKYWFWEIVEMYRKLIFISVILLFDSESDSQIGFAVIAASASGIVYTIFRPMKDKFEDRLQTFVLWVIFFNICLGAVYSRPTLNEGHGDNNSLFVNVMFLILNCAVLVVAVGKGLFHLIHGCRRKRDPDYEVLEPILGEEDHIAE
ncbi:putative leucine-rich repeat-containing protein DDB_G0281931 [Pocillopora verrucosa]|uniref:putative leucine-rich repeat-containing protein DDB_G0281931 n=1 Tax=Pocillopora verrucosa TaxID=203993 RepID=UPI00333E2ABD